MNIRNILSAMALLSSSAALACTGLIAAPGATADGSTLITYAADSHTLYGELYHKPAADHPKGSVRKVVEWDTGKPLGEIPEVAHTYTTIGNMNEHGLAITESTWGGREELAGSGMIDYGSLIYITLERAKTAREAIKIMTDLVKTHGYASEGESFTIADPNEVWIMEMIGKGKTDKGAVWVARRIPDGCISGHANHSRIHKFPIKDKSGETIYSPDVIKFARQCGYFTGKDEDFDFSRAYAVTDGGALRGCDGRVWAFYNKYAADDMTPYLSWILEGKGEPLPLWVKPKAPLTAKDMKWMMRDHFEDTPLDMTADVGAGPYKVPYRWRPLTFTVDSVEYTHERAIATQQTGFSLVAQLKKDAPEQMKGILWFGVDDANTCVYIPMYSCLTSAPHEFAVGNGDLYNLKWDAAFWVNNFVANQAYNRYSQMIPDIRRVQCAIEDSIDTEVNILYTEVAGLDPEVAVKFLNDHAADWSKKYTERYRQLGEYLLVKYLDGNVKREKDGQFERNEHGMPAYPAFPGYDSRYYRSIATDPAGGERLKTFGTID
ncbi:MAG: C69 family dipeptidase [Bacteroides sp.]|nr:C69 family dipeptidase [Bacteroides sp.]MCM1413919.1 C69 family dipeptidase [Bacteroides sp.]MCM1471654.1 C69 family dipeptidase [Bacteroides sp.]